MPLLKADFHADFCRFHLNIFLKNDFYCFCVPDWNNAKRPPNFVEQSLLVLLVYIFLVLVKKVLIFIMKSITVVRIVTFIPPMLIIHR